MAHYAKQEADFYCGPAVVQMVLAKTGIILTQAQLAAELNTAPGVGTTAEAIVKLLTLQGLDTTRKNNATLADIAAALRGGKEVIVAYIEPMGEAHYAVVRALEEKTIVLADPLFGDQHHIPIAQFDEHWRDDEVGACGDRLLITAS